MNVLFDSCKMGANLNRDHCCNVDYSPNDFDLVVSENSIQNLSQDYADPRREQTTTPESSGSPFEISRCKPCNVKPSASKPADEIWEISFDIERPSGGFNFSFQDNRAPHLSVDGLLQLAEVRINSRAEGMLIPEDLSSIPEQYPLEFDAESTGRVEINLVELIRTMPKPRSPPPKPVAKPQLVKRLQIDLKSRRARVLNKA